MLQVTVTNIIPLSKGIQFGLRIEHPKAHWIRFATTWVMYDDLSAKNRELLQFFLQTSTVVDECDTPLFGLDDIR